MPVDDPSSGTVRRLLTPRYVAFPLANAVLYLIVLVLLRETVVQSGQGGRIDVFLWPTYRASYSIGDLGPGARFQFQALFVNHAIGLVPCYLAATVAVNAWAPETVREWRPNISGRILLLSTVGGSVGFAVGFVLVMLSGFEGILLWLSMLVTCVYTVGHAFLTGDETDD
ncbi:hypothetical protein [Halorubellus sp. PRR65]|uniref:hypothetical protein n=1 Tax=Halorubellus sp. PRR65 TaxID=3098148 RepID=UPI002B25A51C|nr:hypothetical protein [Halorubellus sp. PRR65]